MMLAHVALAAGRLVPYLLRHIGDSGRWDATKMLSMAGHLAWDAAFLVGHTAVSFSHVELLVRPFIISRVIFNSEGLDMQKLIHYI